MMYWTYIMSLSHKDSLLYGKDVKHVPITPYIFLLS